MRNITPEFFSPFPCFVQLLLWIFLDFLSVHPCLFISLYILFASINSLKSGRKLQTGKTLWKRVPVKCYFVRNLIMNYVFIKPMLQDSDPGIHLADTSSERGFRMQTQSGRLYNVLKVPKKRAIEPGTRQCYSKVRRA